LCRKDRRSLKTDYELRFSANARKRIAALDRPTKERIIARLEELRTNPFEPRISSELTGQSGLRRSRVGLWRIVYEADQAARAIDVLVVQPRGQVYQRL
jgi:mRNA interferase RelE/StbE